MFCVATTHLLFNQKAGEVKLAQLALLLAELDLMATAETPEQSPLSCLLCGDLNSLPHSPLLRFIETGRLDYSQLTGPQVAGYNGKASSHRLIPIPLLPPDMGIRHDCRHHQPPSKHTSTPAPPAGGGGGEGSGGGGGKSTAAAAATAVLSHPFVFFSAYRHPSPSSPSSPPSTITTYHSSAFETVDYIYFTPSISSAHTSKTTPPRGGRAGFKLLGRRELASGQRLLALGPQPPLPPSLRSPLTGGKPPASH